MENSPHQTIKNLWLRTTPASWKLCGDAPIWTENGGVKFYKGIGLSDFSESSKTSE